MIKHTQHIVAFDKAQFGFLREGLNLMTRDEFHDRAADSIVIHRRHELEMDERYGQLLPYISMYQVAPDGSTHVFAYRRGKGVGESRLVGNFSVGVGGHVDLADVVHQQNTISILFTLQKALARELDEEIDWEGCSPGMSMAGLKYVYGIEPVFIGIINDTSDSVGRVHYGALYSLQIPWDLTPVCKEPELETVGVVALAELAGKPVENWSKIVLALIEEDEEHT